MSATSTSIEERVALLEKELANLTQLIQDLGGKKDWRKTIGMSVNDPGFDDMIRLGRAIREQEDNAGDADPGY